MRLPTIPKIYKKYLPIINARQVQQVLGIAILMMFMYILGRGAGIVETEEYQRLVDEGQKSVLGVTEEEPEPKFIGSYDNVGEFETDRFVWEYGWDRSDENYLEYRKFIESPLYYFNQEEFQLVDEWEIQEGNKIKVVCPSVIKSVIVPDPLTCELYFNGSLLRDDLRSLASCDWKTKSGCHQNVSLTLYSYPWREQDTEYLVVSTYSSGSKDWIYVYKIEGDTITQMKFVNGEFEEDRYNISSDAYEIYGTYEECEVDGCDPRTGPVQLVTYFHEPSMGSTLEPFNNNVEGIYRIWEIAEDSLVHKERVVDLYLDDEQRHWW